MSLTPAEEIEIQRKVLVYELKIRKQYTSGGFESDGPEKKTILEAKKSLKQANRLLKSKKYKNDSRLIGFKENKKIAIEAAIESEKDAIYRKLMGESN